MSGKNTLDYSSIHEELYLNEILLSSREKVEKVVNLCQNFSKMYHVDIDAVNGRNVVDACSFLGVLSFIGHKVVFITNDMKEEFNKQFNALFVESEE